MRTVVIIQARVNSTRLHGKVLADLCGYPVLAHVVRRARQARTPDVVVVATGDIPANDPIVALCQENAWPWFRGSEDDVLRRFYDAALRFDADFIVRITADCPLVSGEEIDRVVGRLRDWGLDYVSNCHPPRLPDGLDCEAFTIAALDRAHARATDSYDREHVTPWLRRELRAANWMSLSYEPDLSKWRLCIDEPADREAMRQIMALAGPDCTWKDALRQLKWHPKIAAINQAIPRNVKEESYV